MTLEYAILGFLNYQPFTGYDLKKVYDNSVRNFWPADQSQIYRALAKLQAQGLAEVEVVGQTDRPDRKVYSITPAGKQELLNWLATPIPLEEPRSPRMVQVFFAAQLPDEVILKIFEEGAEYLRSLLTGYTHVPEKVQEYAQSMGTPREAFFWNLTLESGYVYAKANLDWLDSVIDRIRSGKVPPK